MPELLWDVHPVRHQLRFWRDGAWNIGERSVKQAAHLVRKGGIGEKVGLNVFVPGEGFSCSNHVWLSWAAIRQAVLCTHRGTMQFIQHVQRGMAELFETAFKNRVHSPNDIIGSIREMQQYMKGRYRAKGLRLPMSLIRESTVSLILASAVARSSRTPFASESRRLTSFPRT